MHRIPNGFPPGQTLEEARSNAPLYKGGIDLPTYEAPIAAPGLSERRFEWVFFKTNELNHARFSAEYGSPLVRVVQKAFCGLKMQFDVKAALRASDLIGIVLSKRDVVGMSLLSIPDCLFYEKSFTWIDRIAIDPIAQGNKLATIGLLADLTRFLPEQQIGFIGMFTQNPALIEGYSKLGKATYPICSDYTIGNGPAIMSFARRNLHQCKQRLPIEQEREHISGIIQGLYGRNITPGQPTPYNYSDKIRMADFNPDRGDAVMLVSSF